MFEKLKEKIRLRQIKGKEPYSSIYNIVGFYPENLQLYELAFLHKSSSFEVGDGKWVNNERMEFLGDAVLDAIVADIVYRKFPYKREGFLTNTRSKIVQRETLNRIGVEIGLDKMVRYSTKISSHNNHMYGNALEALIGAIYLDQGYDVCYQFINDIIINKHVNLETLARKEVNFKSNLIEWGQKNKLDIRFELIDSFSDNDGNPVFQTGIMLADVQIGVGVGYSKKESQQNAAKMAIRRLRQDKEFQHFVSNLKRKPSKNTTNSQEPEDLPEDGEINDNNDFTDGKETTEGSTSGNELSRRKKKNKDYLTEEDFASLPDPTESDESIF